MKLNSRLKNLERTARASLGETREDAGEWLWVKLTTMAQRLDGTEPDESWCRRASQASIAAMALLEHTKGASTPVLWAKVKDLAADPDTPIQKLFAGLEALHGAD